MPQQACARAAALQGSRWKSARGPSAAVAPRDALPWRILVRTAAGLCPRAADADPCACVVAASSRKRAARSRGTDVRARTRTPATSACALPGRCALSWRCHSVPPCRTRIKLIKLLQTNHRSHTGVKQTGRFVLPTHVRTQSHRQCQPQRREGMAPFFGWMVDHKLAMVRILDCAFSSVLASKHRGCSA